MEAAQKLVKQRSMEALDKLRTYNVIPGPGSDSRRSSTASSVLHGVNVNSRRVGYKNESGWLMNFKVGK